MPFHRFEEYENVLLTPHLSTALAPVIEGKYLYYCLNQKEAGTGSELHYHPNELLIFVVQGKINAVVGKDRRIISPGTFVLVPPNARHSMKAAEDGPCAYLYIKDQTWSVVGIGADEAPPEKAMSIEEANAFHDSGEAEKRDKDASKSQAIIDGIPDCYYPLLSRLDEPVGVGRRVVWIEGERSALGFYELPDAYDERVDGSQNEQFLYVLQGQMNAQVGNDQKTVGAGDIIEIPKGASYHLESDGKTPVRFVSVRSNAALEDQIDRERAAAAD